jgi:hypothetical protein
MIFRTKKKQRDFVQIDNVLIENPNLSWKAKGLLVYLLRKSDEWKAMMCDLLEHSTDGETAVRSALAELRKAGYAELKVKRGDDGTLEGSEWMIHEEPIHRDRENPHLGTEIEVSRVSVNPSLGKSSPTNTNKTTKTDKTTKTENVDFGDADGNPPESPFDSFWRLYPRHTGKEAARKSWIRQELNRKGDLVIAALTDQKRAGMFRTEEPRFIPHPATWLNQARWEDEITHEKTKPTVTRNPQSIHMRQRDPERCAGPATEMATIIDNRHRRNKPIH